MESYLAIQIEYNKDIVEAGRFELPSKVEKK